MFRHGDVNLHEISEEKWQEIKRTGKRIDHSGKVILARGEATGSVHELSVSNPAHLEVYEKDGLTYLKVLEIAPLTHTHDHETLKVLPKPYVQVPEREVDHFQDSITRKVVD